MKNRGGSKSLMNLATNITIDIIEVIVIALVYLNDKKNEKQDLGQKLFNFLVITIILILFTDIWG